MKRLSVFCGSNIGAQPSYKKAAAALGRLLAEEGIELVYGGGNVGLMGAIADAVLENHGHVIGVIPQSLVEKEVGHQGLPDLRVVKSMHERKALMAELSDGFIAMPGGFGTFEEICEVVTWTQLGLHKKPCGFLNVGGFYNPFIEMIEHATHELFIRRESASIVISKEDPKELLEAFKYWTAPKLGKWLDKNQT